MTVIVVNNVSVKEGGSLLVSRELLARMGQARPTWRWYAVVNSRTSQLFSDMPNVTYVSNPRADANVWKTRWWYETGLPSILNRVRANVLFSLTNYLPSRQVACPTLLLVQHAGHFSEDFKRLHLSQAGIRARVDWEVKDRWVKSSISRATAVTVQTHALADKICAATGRCLSDIHVVAHGEGIASHQRATVEHPGPVIRMRVAYVTKPGVQKNFEVLFAAAARLKRRGVPIILVLTLAKDNPRNAATFALAQKHNVAELIENHGECSAQQLREVYKSAHVFVFPSLCESFGLPMAEAMAYGLPLFVADVASNLEVSGPAGIPFPGHDSDALARVIEELVADPERFRKAAERSLARGRELSWSQAATGTLSIIERLLNEADRVDSSR